MTSTSTPLAASARTSPRPRKPTTFQPCARKGRGERSPGAPGADDADGLHETSFGVPAPLGCRSPTDDRNIRPLQPTHTGRPRHQRRRAARTVTSSGARSASGCSTNRRSHMRGWGTTRSASSTRRSPTKRTSASSVRGPKRTVRTRWAASSSAWQRARSCRGLSDVVSSTTTLRKGPWSAGPPTGSVS